MAFTRTSEGMSPAFNLQSSEWIITPSQISMAIFTRYSCDRCSGLRVWMATTVGQPFSSNSLRVSAGVMYTSAKSVGKRPCDKTFTGPARFTSPCSITIFTPGCSGSVVLNTIAHSCALSMPYFSVIFMVAMISLDSRSTNATSSPVLMPSAVCESVERVMGMGQNRPLAIFMPSHTPCQSAWVMKPSSGVQPPLPSMMRSPVSREEIITLGRVSARRRSAARASPSNNSGFSVSAPWGWTSVDMFIRLLEMGWAGLPAKGRYFSSERPRLGQWNSRCVAGARGPELLDEVGAVAHLQQNEEATQKKQDRDLADGEAGGDGAIGHAVQRGAHHLLLARREPAQPFGAAVTLRRHGRRRGLLLDARPTAQLRGHRTGEAIIEPARLLQPGLLTQQAAQMRGEPRTAQVEHEGGGRAVLREIEVRGGVAAREAEALQEVLIERQGRGGDEQCRADQQRDEVAQQRRAARDVGRVAHVDEAHEPARRVAVRGRVLGELARAQTPEVMLGDRLAHEVVQRAAVHRQDHGEAAEPAVRGFEQADHAGVQRKQFAHVEKIRFTRLGHHEFAVARLRIAVEQLKLHGGAGATYLSPFLHVRMELRQGLQGRGHHTEIAVAELSVAVQRGAHEAIAEQIEEFLQGHHALFGLAGGRRAMSEVAQRTEAHALEDIRTSPLQVARDRAAHQVMHRPAPARLPHEGESGEAFELRQGHGGAREVAQQFLIEAPHDGGRLDVFAQTLVGQLAQPALSEFADDLGPLRRLMQRVRAFLFHERGGERKREGMAGGEFPALFGEDLVGDAIVGEVFARLLQIESAEWDGSDQLAPGVVNAPPLLQREASGDDHHHALWELLQKDVAHPPVECADLFIGVEVYGDAPLHARAMHGGEVLLLALGMRQTRGEQGATQPKKQKNKKKKENTHIEIEK